MCVCVCVCVCVCACVFFLLLRKLELSYDEEHNIRCLMSGVNMHVDRIYRVRYQPDIKTYSNLF